MNTLRTTFEFREGLDAYAEGDSRAACPYKVTEEPANRAEWMAGYQHAEDLDRADD